MNYEMIPNKICITVKEAAEICGLCENSMRKLVNRRDFPKFRVGRRIVIVREAFIKWLNSTTDN